MADATPVAEKAAPKKASKADPKVDQKVTKLLSGSVYVAN